MSLEHEREPEDEYRVDKNTYDVSKFEDFERIHKESFFPKDNENTERINTKGEIYQNCRRQRGDRISRE